MLHSGTCFAPTTMTMNIVPQTRATSSDEVPRPTLGDSLTHEMMVTRQRINKIYANKPNEKNILWNEWTAGALDWHIALCRRRQKNTVKLKWILGNNEIDLSVGCLWMRCWRVVELQNAAF